MAKPTLPQGTRDFAPDTVRKRNYILDTIRSVFELYGFEPLETPALENLETLMGKYGDEGDKLVFRILNNGLGDAKNIDKARAGFENAIQGRNDKNLTERALRYDLTIPFARYVAMNHNHLNFPFKRYQVQPVWRADRPQKGRYREFYQCDADVVGSRSLLNEVELAIIYHEVLIRLGISGYELRINSRKILSALAELCGGAEKLTDITTAIDKMDKIGEQKVIEELRARNLTDSQVAIVEQYLRIKGGNNSKLQQAAQLFNDTSEGKTGIGELFFILEKIQSAQERISVHVDFTLARGLNYYTGTIFEAKAPAEIQIGSIGGGGRYDDLTGLFGVPGIPGVGISFGVDRIYDVMEEMKLFPQTLSITTQVMFLNIDEAAMDLCFNLVQSLRKSGTSCELFPDPARIDKQYKYAEKKNIPFVATVNAEQKNVKLKDIRNGDVKELNFEELKHMFAVGS